MDSGNSGSLQSSSGGDEEYDSRAESISVFLNNNNNNNPLTHVGPISNPPPPQPPPPSDHHQHHQTHHSSSSSFIFDPSSNYFDPLSSSSSRSPPPAPPPHLTNPNSFLNLDMVWSKNLRSETNCTDLGNFIPSSSQTQQFFTNQTQSRTTFPSIQIPHQGPESSTTPRGSTSNDQTTNTTTTTNMVRNPKKRSRASRRAPTTVLTTDTTNFRAMVQEFTGIPAPPFTSSHFPRTRLDLFGTSSTLRSATTHLEPPPPPYLLRPFAQKFQPPFLSSTSTSSSSISTTSPSMVDAIASTTTANNINIGSSNNNNNNNSHSNSSTSHNYHLSSDLALLKQPQNLLDINMQNPILNLHSLLQPSPKYPLPNSSVSNDSHLKMGVLEEFGLSHGHVSTNLTGLHTIVAGDGVGSGAGSNNNESDHHHHHNHQGLLRSINGNYNNSQRVVNGKVNFSSSSSDHFHGDKGPEINVASRSEGMVESWICSSD